jgi:hypothetical protein
MTSSPNAVDKTSSASLNLPLSAGTAQDHPWSAVLSKLASKVSERPLIILKGYSSDGLLLMRR